MRPVDFSRNVICIMGLPFDVVDMDQAVKLVRTAAQQRVPCLVSTPNLNFVVSASKDEEFRNSVLHSQLSLADGMPIVWIARLLGLSMRERVSGASLFEALGRAPHPPVRVFFIGGADGVAQAACERINQESGGGLSCVGFESPGFASVEAMSSDECLERINRTQPDFVVVSLGAKKGQAWIERNRGRLNAPVISYLGAVINFAAGHLQRAPHSLQRVGLEWAWRIKEEPGLWRRYARDAVALARMFAGGVIPLWWQRLWLGRQADLPKLKVEVELLADSEVVLTLSGACSAPHADTLRSAFASVGKVRRICVDLSAVEQVDAVALGLMLLLRGQQRDTAGALVFRGAPKAIQRQFRYHGAAYLLAG